MSPKSEMLHPAVSVERWIAEAQGGTGQRSIGCWACAGPTFY